MQLIEVAQVQVEDLKNYIQDKEPKLFELEKTFDSRKGVLDKSIKEATIKKDQIAVISAEQNQKL